MVSLDDRMRVQEVLALLKEPGTLDELEIGQVRDAYADDIALFVSSERAAKRVLESVVAWLRKHVVAWLRK